MIKVLLFAGLAEKVGQSEIEVDAQSLTVEQLMKQLISEFPVIEADVSQAMIAVNEELVDEKTIIQSNDTVAFIPPVSGG